MIDRNHRQPTRGGVAGAAIISGGNVAARFTGCRCTVMATHTCHITQCAVIDLRRRGYGKTVTGMTDITRAASGDMTRFLAEGKHSVMAIDTLCG